MKLTYKKKGDPSKYIGKGGRPEPESGLAMEVLAPVLVPACYYIVYSKTCRARPVYSDVLNQQPSVAFTCGSPPLDQRGEETAVAFVFLLPSFVIQPLPEEPHHLCQGDGRLLHQRRLQAPDIHQLFQAGASVSSPCLFLRR